MVGVWRQNAVKRLGDRPPARFWVTQSFLDRYDELFPK
jgi:hypothetical protein